MFDYLFYATVIKKGNEECETDLIRQLRNGVYNALLPETPAQLRQMINTLTVKRVNLPGPFLNGFLHLRLRLLGEHKKGNVQERLFQFRCFQLLVLSSLLEYDYPHIERNYQQLRQLHRPALILWGRQDRVKQRNHIKFLKKLCFYVGIRFQWCRIFLQSITYG